MRDNAGDVPQDVGVGLPVIIIGSAIFPSCTGLAIAQGLKKAGIPSIIFEKHAAIFSPGERDWNMGLHWAVPILKSLIPDSASAQLQSVQVDPNTPTTPIDTLAFLNGATGDITNAPEIPNFHRLRRLKLRKLLSKDLDIRWNKRLKDIVFEHDGESVTAVFKDGEHVTGRLVIGADGARSTVRSILLKSEIAASTRLPYSATFVQAKFTSEQALGGQAEDWTFFFYISWNLSIEQQDEERKTFGNKERLAQVKKKWKGYCEPWKSAFECVPEDQAAWYFDLTVWDPSLAEHNWDNENGRVTLTGDAAHPTTYQRGKGLNHSITDAGRLVESLTTAALPSCSN
ncbi:hypothetical protein ACEPPN_012423 [Leptodophora sp. 'Broadleaf-Isolate-01']